MRSILMLLLACSSVYAQPFGREDSARRQADALESIDSTMRMADADRRNDRVINDLKEQQRQEAEYNRMMQQNAARQNLAQLQALVPQMQAMINSQSAQIRKLKKDNDALAKKLAAKPKAQPPAAKGDFAKQEKLLDAIAQGDNAEATKILKEMVGDYESRKGVKSPTEVVISKKSR